MDVCMSCVSLYPECPAQERQPAGLHVEPEWNGEERNKNEYRKNRIQWQGRTGLVGHLLRQIRRYGQILPLSTKPDGPGKVGTARRPNAGEWASEWANGLDLGVNGSAFQMDSDSIFGQDVITHGAQYRTCRRAYLLPSKYSLSRWQNR